METEIRKYVEADKEACMVAFKSNVPAYFTKEEIDLFESFLDRLYADGSNENKRTQYFVILNGNQIVGCAGFGDKEDTGDITLAWGLIHKKFHRKGFGKRLLLYRLQLIKHNYPNNPVYVDTTQFSFPFFEQFGFETTKITNNYYAVGMHRYDMVFK